MAGRSPHAAVTAWPVREDGRKCVVAGELRDGDRLLAEATALFLEIGREHDDDTEAGDGRP